MRTSENKVSNGTLKIPQEILSKLNLKDGETVLFESNEDGTVTIRKKETIASLKGIIKKGDTPELHPNGDYQFETSSKKREKS